MKKSTIIAASIASLLAGVAGSAAAESTLYGAAHAAIQHQDVNGAGGKENWEVTNNTSKVGIKGSEDLGNGMKAIYQMEMAYDLTDGGGVGGARNSFVGLSGDFGTALIGRHDTPDKMAFYAAGNDHLGDSVIDLNTTFGFKEDRVSNAIAYVLPAFGDLTVAVAIIPGEDATGNGAVGNGLADGRSIGVMYKAGAVKAGFGYHDKADVTGKSSDTVMNLGGSFTMDNLTVGLQYQALDTSKVDTKIYALVGAFKMDANTLIASYGKNDNDALGDTNVLNLGMAHAMSKRTTVYVGFTDQSDTVGTMLEGTKYAFGMNHKF
jgi:predicted porin